MCEKVCVWENVCVFECGYVHGNEIMHVYDLYMEMYICMSACLSVCVCVWLVDSCVTVDSLHCPLHGPLSMKGAQVHNDWASGAHRI